MGSQQSVPVAAELDDATLLRITAAGPLVEGNPCRLRIRLQLANERRRTLQVEPVTKVRHGIGVVCYCSSANWEVHKCNESLSQILSAERFDGTSGGPEYIGVTTSNWRFTTGQVLFTLHRRSNEDVTVRLTSVSLLGVHWVDNDVHCDWEPFEKRTACAVCTTPFASAHPEHCRCCGRLVCSTCCPHFAHVQGVAPEVQTCSLASWCGPSEARQGTKVCVDCYYG
eukprot:Sspe_Gene.44331::Locus_21728_Transcript_3_6_Confidence_0.250_Length_740::g.44331::m.44331